MSSKMSLMPNISIPRSRWWTDFNHSFDMFHGDVVPVDCFEVVPGDEFSYELSSLIRMQTPIVPIMGNIKCCLHAFFVPMRLLWDDTEKFYGDPSNHDKISTVTPVDPDSISVPHIAALNQIDTVQFMYSVQDYLGKDDLLAIRAKMNNDTNFLAWLADANISLLKERAYLTVWNDHFRPSLMVPPVLINKGGNLTYGTASFLGANSSLVYPFKPLKGFKQYDYFTASTLSPQYATNAVALPIGLTAPIEYYPGSTGTYPSMGSPAMAALTLTTPPHYYLGSQSSTPGTMLDGVYKANLENATAATINQIRYAFQLQKYFERSNYGNRYFEILNAHYGITNPDSRLQRSERLGSHEFYINISQVVSTADTESGTSGQNLGNTGAVSCTPDKCHLFTKSFSEPGYVMVVATTKYDRVYSSGWLREDLRKNRFEFYSPEFANLGDQGTKLIEIQSYSSAGVNSAKDIFGYQEHWAEYRYRKNLVSGSLRAGKTMDIWTLADQFDDISGDAHAKLVLGYDFLVEDRRALSRLLASGNSGPDYICDFHAKILTTREMPLYSIPGLIDHFGAL